MASKPKSEAPGSYWRLTTKSKSKNSLGLEIESLGNKGIFDELVIDQWFHIEQMDDRSWWGRIGPLDLWITIDDNNDPIVHIRGLEFKGNVKIGEKALEELKKKLI